MSSAAGHPPRPRVRAPPGARANQKPRAEHAAGPPHAPGDSTPEGGCPSAHCIAQRSPGARSGSVPHTIPAFPRRAPLLSHTTGLFLSLWTEYTVSLATPPCFPSKNLTKRAMTRFEMASILYLKEVPFRTSDLGEVESVENPVRVHINDILNLILAHLPHICGGFYCGWIQRAKQVCEGYERGGGHGKQRSRTLGGHVCALCGALTQRCDHPRCAFHAGPLLFPTCKYFQHAFISALVRGHAGRAGGEYSPSPLCIPASLA